jgi:glycosyltransferase involved in cell wall biosynthesis
MRIAYDYQIFGRQQYGGISRYFYELAKGISLKRQHQVAVIAALHVNRYLEHRPDTLRVTGVSMPSIRKVRAVYRAIDSLCMKHLLARFDPAIVHETYYSTRRFAPMTSRVVLTIFDMIHEKFGQSFSRFDRTRQAKAAAAARADHIICISRSTQQDVIDILGVPQERTSVVYLGSSLEAPADEARFRLEKPFLLYVGDRGGYKNFAALLRTYSRSQLLSREFQLLCFGGGEFTRAELRLMTEHNVPRQSVRYMSGSDACLAVLYASAAALVYPSLYEGFGMPLLEAMSVGCPVVCSNTSSLPEVAGEAAELFDPLEEDDMAAAIERVVTSGDRRQTLVASGRDRSAMFSWRRCVEETMSIYEDRLGLAQ